MAVSVTSDGDRTEYSRGHDGRERQGQGRKGLLAGEDHLDWGFYGRLHKCAERRSDVQSFKQTAR